MDKGHVKLENVSRNPNKLLYLYFLTPQGAFEKSRLAYRFMKRALKQYGAIESGIRDTLLDLKKNKITRILLVGANDITEIVLKAADDIDMEVVGIVDGRSSFSPHSVPVFTHDTAPWSEAERIVLCVLDDESLQERLDHGLISRDKIVIIPAGNNHREGNRAEG